jgi:hypothetical protein
MELEGVQRDIESLLESGAPIPAEKVRYWIDLPDLNVQGLVFDLLFECPERVQGSVDEEQISAFFLRYLEQCLRDPVVGKYAHGRYMAGHSLRAWFERLWKQRPNTEHHLLSIRDMLSQLCRQGSDATRDAVTTSVLEHLFANADVVAFFQSWKHDSCLNRIYTESILLASDQENKK